MEANKLNDTVTQLRGHILMPRRRAARQAQIDGARDGAWWVLAQGVRLSERICSPIYRANEVENNCEMKMKCFSQQEPPRQRSRAAAAERRRQRLGQKDIPDRPAPKWNVNI